MKNSISLIGMAGAGKSSVGKELAKSLDFRLIDSDVLIEDQYGKSLGTGILDVLKTIKGSRFVEAINKHLEKDQDFQGNYEIDEIFNVPISFLMDENNINYNEFSRKDLKVYIPTWVYNGNKIWGLTALITADLLNTCFNASIKTDLDLMRTYDDY